MEPTQKELLLRGKIHGYYRMYWGKKISSGPRRRKRRFATTIHLHDRYALDGAGSRTPTPISSGASGLHDRPWGERPSSARFGRCPAPVWSVRRTSQAYLREIEYLERTGKELTREDHHIGRLRPDRPPAAEDARPLTVIRFMS